MLKHKVKKVKLGVSKVQTGVGIAKTVAGTATIKHRGKKLKAGKKLLKKTIILPP